MAKRTKKAKNSRSNLRVESLEQRQLLANIVGGGVEVLSDFTHSNGNVYDQVLMTGPSVTVTPDPGQIVRVSFLDQGGDIVQAEFAGSGTMHITLEDLKRAGDAGYLNPNPAQNLPAGGYVQGLASITIDKSELSTNLNIFAAGKLQNPGFFNDPNKNGGDGLADIARIILVGNEKNEAGFTNMGSIIAGSAVFSAETGVVGIRGENVAVQGKVVIGDIDAKGSGVPTLMFNTNSQFQYVSVRGGDLRQSNGTSFDSFGNGAGGAPGGSPGNGNNRTLGGFSFFNSTDGQAANTTFRPAVPVDASAIRLATVDQQTLMSGDWTYDWTNPQAVKVTQNGTDVSQWYGGDWLAKGGIQKSIDYAFERRTFLGNITVTGDLPAGIAMNLADARANVTFNNNFYGNLTVDGFGASIDGTLEVKGNLDGTVNVQGLDRTATSPGAGDGQQNVLNALLVGGSTGSFTDVRAEDINSVTIRNNFSGIISTDVTRGGQWTPMQRTAGGAFVDVEGRIGNVSVGYDAAGASTGGSIVNGSIQGMSGIGNVKVGGDIWGSSPLGSVFSTESNPGAAPNDVGRYGSANIGTIDVRGDVDLDGSNAKFISIGYNEDGNHGDGIYGNGNFGNITVQGLTTTNTVPGAKIGTETQLIPGSESFVRILSPFTDNGFTTNPALGQKLVTNYDPDGVSGPLDDTYFVTANDVKAGAQIYDLTTKAMVAAKVGDRVPALAGGAPIIDSFGNVLYRQNTALFEGKTQVVDVFGPPTVTVVSGNRGNLDGVFNNFGRVAIYGLLGAQQKVTGNISITDNVDMTFGGVQIDASGTNNQAVTGTVGTIGQITINNTAGATSDLVVTGVIGSPAAIAATNGGTSHIGLTGFNATGFEDVRFAGNEGGYAFHVTGIEKGVNVTTVTGVGDGTGPGTVSPSVTFDTLIALDNGTSEAAQTALLSLNTGAVNSQIIFNQGSGILVDDGGNTGQGSAIGDINLNSDYIRYSGQLTGRKFGNITLTGGAGINSANDTAVLFNGTIAASTIGAITASATSGDVMFVPAAINGLGTKGTVNNLTPMASIGSIVLNTAGSNNGGDIWLGSGGLYNANVGPITVTAGHKLFVNEAGTVIDNPGNVTINYATSGNVGNIAVTTTTGNINNAILIQGDASDISYSVGAVTVDQLDNLIGGPGAIGDLARFGNITADQTIWGKRGVTTFEAYGQNADGSAKTLPEFTVEGVTYKILPSGNIDARLNYAGASTASGDAFIAKTGGGNASIVYNIIGHDDNNDGVTAISEIGHGGNVNVSSISGDIRFAGGTNLPDYTHVATLGNVALKTGSYAQPSGLLTGSEIGNIDLGFNALDTALANLPLGAGNGVQSTGGFEGNVGNISAVTNGGDITFAGLFGALQNVNGIAAADFTDPFTSRFDGTVGTVTLTAGSVAHSGGVAVGNVWTSEDPVIFNQAHGLVKASVVDVGQIGAIFQSNGPRTATGNGYEFSSQQGPINAYIYAGNYDANNNGLITANEYGRTGDLALTSQGGDIYLRLGSASYKSALEQSIIGNVTINNQAFVGVKNGATDTIGTGTTALGSAVAGAAGNITIDGASWQVGAVGNLVANTNTGLITHSGVFGDLGTSTFTTSSYSDVDTDPNSTAEAPVLLGSGNIVLGNGFSTSETYALIVNGKHGTSTYTVTEDGTIMGTAYYGGAAVGASSLVTSSARGDTKLSIWLQDYDADGSGNITASEYGTFGSSNLKTTSGGDVTLQLGTDQNNAAVLARNLVSQFTFGDVDVSVVDRYTSTSATASDVLADAANITITGVGSDATNAAAFGPYTGNRGNVGNITAGTVRGNILLNGTFGGVGNQNLTITRYVDDIGANDKTFAGNLNYSPTILGTHGTATLRTTDLGATGTGTITGGAITGVATFGGAAANAVSVDAKTERANINLDVFALGYDINGDGKITDGSVNNIPGDFEFAKVGNVMAESTSAGDITLGLGIATADGSKIGSQIGNVTAVSDDDIYTVAANGPDTQTNLGNVTVIGKSPATNFSAGSIGTIGMTVKTGDATLTGNFGSIAGVTINTGTYTDADMGGGNPGITAAGDIILGNSNTGADNAVADVTGFTTLNIAGSTGASTFTVYEMGTIKGEVFSAGAGGGSWTLVAAQGGATAASATANGVSGTAIDVNFVAGFDSNDTDADQRTGIDNGSFGDITATSTFGDVIIGVGGRTSGSTIGNVSVSTGSSIVEVGGADKFTHGSAEIQGVSSYTTKGADLVLGNADDPLVFSGTVGNLSATTAYGQARITGDFNATGTISLTASAKVDVDTNTAITTEDPVVAFAGDVFFGTGGAPVYFAGNTGAISLRAVDTSVLAAGLAGKAGTVANMGNVSGNAFFAGAGGAFNATTDRGTIDVDLELGFDKDNAGLIAAGGVDNDRSTGEDTGTLGAVTLASTDGNILATLDSTTTGSTYGAVVITTGSTITAVSGADNIIAQGSITVDGNNDGETANGNLGTITSLTATAATGNISLTGIQANVGPVTLTTGSNIDLDSNSSISGEDPIVNVAGDITLGLTIRRNHGPITASAGDIANAGLAAGPTGDIAGALTFNGPLTGGTSSFVATTQQGNIGVNISSLVYQKVAGDSGLTVDSATTNSDDYVGAAGDIVATSLYGDITLGLNTGSQAKIAGTDSIRFSSIGNTTASTGASYLPQAGPGNDVEQLRGDIAIAGGSTSNGILGNVTATTTTGNVSFGVGGTFNNVVGNVTLTAGSYTDTVAYKAGNVTFNGNFATTNNNAGDFDTTLGAVNLTAGGAVDNAGVGAAGNVNVNVDFGGGWTDAGTLGTIEAGEQALFTGGAFNATVTDGQVLAVIGAANGFGATLPVTSLKSTGGSTFAGTGNVVVTGGTGSFASVASFTAETIDGDAAFVGSWETPTVTSFNIISGKGDAAFSGDLMLDTPNATNFNSVNAKIQDFTVWAKNGRAFLDPATTLGANTLNRPNLAAANDNRTFVLENITFKAAGTTGTAGNAFILGQIGGAETTGITNLVFDVPTLTGLTTLDGTGAGPAVLAHDMTKVTFNGNASLAGATEILASDALTNRTRIGSVDYTAITVGAAANKGANLDTIGELIFNGSVAGNVATSLITGNRAEIEASSIGKLTINAPVDPTTTVKYTAQNLDILTSNARGGTAQGEALLVLGNSSLDTPNAITAFAIGDISVTHSLQGNSTGSTVFAGSNAISALGGMGNLTIKSGVSGSVQAPLLTATGGAWFSVGDGDGLGNATANVDANGNGAFVAYADVNTTAGLAGDKVSIGAVSIDAGSSYAPPAAQNPDFGNIGGSNASATDGLVILAAAIAPAAGDTAATRAAAYTELYGYVASVEIKNAGIRPDADGTDFTVAAGGAFAAGVAGGSGDAGALIAVAGDTSTAGIGDVINDLNPALVPLTAGNGRILGLAGVSTAYDQGDVVVYVL